MKFTVSLEFLVSHLNSLTWAPSPLANFIHGPPGPPKSSSFSIFGSLLRDRQGIQPCDTVPPPPAARTAASFSVPVQHEVQHLPLKQPSLGPQHPFLQEQQLQQTCRQGAQKTFLNLQRRHKP